MSEDTPQLLTSEDIFSAQFPATKFRDGYDQNQIDDYLDEVVRVLSYYEALNASPEAEVDLAYITVRGKDVREVDFDYTRMRVGYDQDAVDDYLDLVAATLEAYEKLYGIPPSDQRYQVLQVDGVALEAEAAEKAAASGELPPEAPLPTTTTTPPSESASTSPAGSGMGSSVLGTPTGAIPVVNPVSFDQAVFTDSDAQASDSSIVSPDFIPVNSPQPVGANASGDSGADGAANSNYHDPDLPEEEAYEGYPTEEPYGTAEPQPGTMASETFGQTDEWGDVPSYPTTTTGETPAAGPIQAETFPETGASAGSGYTTYPQGTQYEESGTPQDTGESAYPEAGYPYDAAQNVDFAYPQQGEGAAFPTDTAQPLGSDGYQQDAYAGYDQDGFATYPQISQEQPGYEQYEPYSQPGQAGYDTGYDQYGTATGYDQAGYDPTGQTGYEGYQDYPYEAAYENPAYPAQAPTQDYGTPDQQGIYPGENVPSENETAWQEDFYAPGTTPETNTVYPGESAASPVSVEDSGNDFAPAQPGAAQDTPPEFIPWDFTGESPAAPPANLYDDQTAFIPRINYDAPYAQPDSIVPGGGQFGDVTVAGPQGADDTAGYEGMDFAQTAPGMGYSSEDETGSASYSQPEPSVADTFSITEDDLPDLPTFDAEAFDEDSDVSPSVPDLAAPSPQPIFNSEPEPLESQDATPQTPEAPAYETAPVEPPAAPETVESAPAPAPIPQAPTEPNVSTTSFQLPKLTPVEMPKFDSAPTGSNKLDATGLGSEFGSETSPGEAPLLGVVTPPLPTPGVGIDLGHTRDGLEFTPGTPVEEAPNPVQSTPPEPKTEPKLADLPGILMTPTRSEADDDSEAATTPVLPHEIPDVPAKAPQGTMESTEEKTSEELTELAQANRAAVPAKAPDVPLVPSPSDEDAAKASPAPIFPDDSNPRPLLQGEEPLAEVDPDGRFVPHFLAGYRTNLDTFTSVYGSMDDGSPRPKPASIAKLEAEQRRKSITTGYLVTVATSRPLGADDQVYVRLPDGREVPVTSASSDFDGVHLSVPHI